MRNERMKKIYFYVIFPILAWATTPVVTKILIKTLSSLQIVFYMFLFALITLFFILMSKKKLKLLKTYSKKDMLIMTVLGMIGIIGHHLLYTIGFRYIPAAEANVLNYLWPVLIIIFAYFILREKFTIKKLLAIILGFIGTYLIISKGNLIPLFTNLKGDFIMIGAAASWALFTVLTKKYDYEKYSSTFYYILSTVIILVVMMLTTGSFSPITLKEILFLIYLGIATKALAIAFWIRTVKELGTTKMATISYLSPFTAFFFINIFIGEQIYWYYILALVLIVGGVIIESRK